MGEINIVIWQGNEVGKAVRLIIEKGYAPLLERLTGQKINQIDYVAFETNAINGIIGFNEMCQRYLEGKIQMIIIPTQNYIGQSMFVTESIARGVKVEDFYLASRVEKGKLTEQKILSFLTPLVQSKYLPYMEFHIADHCNLNCKACEHYSGLVHEEIFTDYDKFERDLRRLHEFVDDIGMIRILGGEPLLNPDIEKYIKLVHELYPQTLRYVVTNGLKLLSMPDSFYHTVRDTYTNIWMSYYPPVRNKRDQIEDKLRQMDVNYGISDLNMEFTMKQVLEPMPGLNHFYHCMQAHCHNLYDGKIAACFLPFTTKYFNREFDKNLPEDGYVDIYEEDMTSERIQRRLLTPFERCRYCSDKSIPVKWEVMHEPSILSDWVVEE
ncbi:MAG: 4Fe-4S cluster-binding domain-containing protein [Lachnospiraceae bacterium]|nr:4Fe-4S cluster-binding domain-containing protein [Lachnospiraceae bacterium]